MINDASDVRSRRRKITFQFSLERFSPISSHALKGSPFSSSSALFSLSSSSYAFQIRRRRFLPNQRSLSSRIPRPPFIAYIYYIFTH